MVRDEDQPGTGTLALARSESVDPGTRDPTRPRGGLAPRGRDEEELLEIAGQIVARSYAATSREHHPLPSSEELDEMAKFSSSAAECEVLCQELPGPRRCDPGRSGPRRVGIASTIRLINVRMRKLHCHPCLPS